MKKKFTDTTAALHQGRPTETNRPIPVNIPSYRLSTVSFPSMEVLKESDKAPYDGLRYGRYGTPTSFAFEEAVCALEGGYRSISMPSGLSAITATLLALLETGDHLLMVDSTYHATRQFCNNHLSKLGIKTTYYAPNEPVEPHITPRTKIIFVESPGSLTFEMQDIPAIAAIAHRHNITVVMDTTWATPLYFKALEKGVDVSIHAATKFIVGHSDAMLGVITCVDPDLWKRIKLSIIHSGVCAGSEELYLGLRGLRTLAVRLKQHQDSGLYIAQWLETRPEIAKVFYPALPSDPGYRLWKRDFSGACGVFGLELHPVAEKHVENFIDNLSLFGLGYSWGGYESLIIPTWGKAIERTAQPWKAKGLTLRLHIGLEDVSELQKDLSEGLNQLSRYLKE